MLQTTPKFRENKEWYFVDEKNPIQEEYDEICYRLTDKAPKEAVESYLQYCSDYMLYGIGFVPEFVKEEYRKHMARFENEKNNNK